MFVLFWKKNTKLQSEIQVKTVRQNRVKRLAKRYKFFNVQVHLSGMRPLDQIEGNGRVGESKG
jgi:hypothetical protein